MKVYLLAILFSITLATKFATAGNLVCSSLEKDFAFYQGKQNALQEKDIANCPNTIFEDLEQFTKEATIQSEAAAKAAPAPSQKANSTKRCMNLTELQTAYDKAIATKVLIEGLKAIRNEMVNSFENSVLNFKLGSGSGAMDAQTFAKDFQDKVKGLAESSNKQLKLNKEKYETLAGLKSFMESPYNNESIQSPITNVETLNNRCLDILDNLNFSFLSREKKSSVSDMQTICKDLKKNIYSPNDEPLKSLLAAPVNATKFKSLDAKSALQAECVKLDGFFKNPSSPKICVKMLTREKDAKENPEIDATLNGFFEAYNRLDKSVGAKKNAAKTIFNMTGFGSDEDVKRYQTLLAEFDKLQVMAKKLNEEMDKCIKDKLACAFNPNNFRTNATPEKDESKSSINSIANQLQNIEAQKTIVLKEVAALKGGDPDLSKSELVTKINEFVDTYIRDKYNLFVKQKKEWKDNLSSTKAHSTKQNGEMKEPNFSEERKKAENSLEKECKDFFAGIAESLTSKLKIDCKSYTFASCPEAATNCVNRVSIDKLFTDKNSSMLAGIKDIKSNQTAKSNFDKLNQSSAYAKTLAVLDKPNSKANLTALKNDTNFQAKHAEYEATTQSLTESNLPPSIDIDKKIIQTYKDLKSKELQSINEEFNSVCNRLFEGNEKSKAALNVNCENATGTLACSSIKKGEKEICEKVKAHFEKSPDFKKLQFLLIKKDKVNESLNVVNDPKNDKNFGAQKEIIYKKLYEDFKALLATYGKTCNDTIRIGETSDGLQDKALQNQINLMNCINENGNLDNLATKSDKKLSEIKQQISDITKSDSFIFWEKAKMLHFDLFNQQCVTRKQITIEDTAYASCDKNFGDRPLSVKNYMINGAKIIGKMFETYVDGKVAKREKFSNTSEFCQEVNSYLKSGRDSKASAEDFKLCDGHFSDIKQKKNNDENINYYNPNTMQLVGRQAKPSLAAPIMTGVTQATVGSISAVMNNQIDSSRINYMGAIATFNQQRINQQQAEQNACWALLAQGKSCTSSYFNASLPYTGYNFGGLSGQLPYSSINYPYPAGTLNGSPSLFQFGGTGASSIYYSR